MGVEALALAGDGSLLVGIGQAGADLGIQTIAGGGWKSFSMPGENASALAVAALLNDRDNGVWISTRDSGIYHVHGGRTDRFRQIDGLSSDTVTGLFEDHEGNVWYGHGDPASGFSLLESPGDRLRVRQFHDGGDVGTATGWAAGTRIRSNRAEVGVPRPVVKSHPAPAA